MSVGMNIQKVQGPTPSHRQYIIKTLLHYNFDFTEFLCKQNSFAHLFLQGKNRVGEKGNNMSKNKKSFYCVDQNSYF